MADREIEYIEDGEPNGMEGLIDGAGNALFAWGVNVKDSNDSYIQVRRYNPAGQVTGDWRRDIGTDPQKSKASGLGLLAAGADLWITYWGHTTIYTQEPRHGFARVAVFPGIVVPRTDPNLGPAYEEENLPAVGGGSGGGGEPVDYARIEQIVADEINRLIGEFGGGSVRGGLGEKAMDGARDVFTDAARAATYRTNFSNFLYDNPGLYQRLIETTYMVIDEHRVIEAAYKTLGLPWPPPGRAVFAAPAPLPAPPPDAPAESEAADADD